ncbi:MAG: V-type ATP synthase subunit D, partial [Hadesarchaea archaeon]|nr:V-type ATP synthase subunit D [Hadesarchaea archaeon]
MAASTASVQPTRGELLKLKKRINLAKRGHELLKEKQDALITEFFDILDKLEEVKEETQKELNEAFKSLIETKVIMGSLELEKATEETISETELEIDTRNIMGVKVPVIESEEILP